MTDSAPAHLTTKGPPTPEAINHLKCVLGQLHLTPSVERLGDHPGTPSAPGDKGPFTQLCVRCLGYDVHVAWLHNSDAITNIRALMIPCIAHPLSWIAQGMSPVDVRKMKLAKVAQALKGQNN